MMTDALNRQNSSFTFSLRTLIFATALVAWILGINKWLGSPYGWLTAIPMSFALPVWISDPRTFAGALLGFLAFAALGEFWIIGWDKSHTNYIPSLITIGGYGGALGAAIHTFLLRRRVLGSIVILLTLIAFGIVVRS